MNSKTFLVLACSLFAGALAQAEDSASAVGSSSNDIAGKGKDALNKAKGACDGASFDEKEGAGFGSKASFGENDGASFSEDGDDFSE